VLGDGTRRRDERDEHLMVMMMMMMELFCGSMTPGYYAAPS
jgi:hypothetical protein